MLETCSFEFHLRALTPVHFGTGETVSIRKLRADHPQLAGLLSGLRDVENRAQREVGVRTIQRDNSLMPCCEATTLRGAIRRLPGIEAEALFGPEQIPNAQAAADSALWLYAGQWVARPEGYDCDDLPFWDSDKGSFIETGHARDRDLNSVADGLLYHTELVPEGACFRFSGIFQGSAEEFEDLCMPLFEAMAGEEGFSVGADKGHGQGRLRLSDSRIAVCHKIYNAAERRFDLTEPEFDVVPANHGAGPSHRLILHCAGGFLIADPLRKSTAENPPDLHELRRSQGRLMVNGKPVMQALRAKSAWLETMKYLTDNRFDYDDPDLPVDNIDRILKPNEDLTALTITQRLFGVAGFGKTVSIRFNQLTPRAERRFVQQRLQLDVFTQAPMDGALAVLDCPADVTLDVTLVLDENRYKGVTMRALFQRDSVHLAAVLDEVTGDRRCPLRLGHGVGTGLGWFSFVEPGRQRDEVV